MSNVRRPNSDNPSDLKKCLDDLCEEVEKLSDAVVRLEQRVQQLEVKVR